MGGMAVKAIHSLILARLRGEVFPCLQDVVYVFVAKVDGESPPNSVDVASTRPLALRNAGVEVATTALSRAVRPVMSTSAAAEQRGFISARNFVGCI